MAVAISYRLFDAEGRQVDEVLAEQPLRYIDGYAQVILGLADGLRGARVGECRSIEVSPERAFGKRDESALLEVDPRDLSDGASVVVGDELLAVAPDGVEAAYRVVEVSDEIVLADLNHPLAGQQVRFEVTVLAIRPASDEELDAAYTDIDERIVYDAAIVYGSGPDNVAEPSAAAPAEQASGLVQLRPRVSHSRSCNNQPPSSSRDKP